MRHFITKLRLLNLVVIALAALGCGPAEGPEAPPTVAPARTPPPISNKPKIIAYGDSLTAGFGLDSWEKSYPAQLQKHLDSEGYDFQVLNYGFGGDTTERGLDRLPLASEISNTRIFILELGANDVMQHIPATEIRKNLSEIIRRLREKHIEVLLCGIRSPQDYGPEYAAEIDEVYRNLAEENHLSLVPDFMAGVAGHEDLLLPDKIHPNEMGVRVIERNVYEELNQLLAKNGPSGK